MFAEIHIERGRIRAVLPCATGTIIRTETDTYEYPGCHVLPGFVDSHAHVVGYGERLSSLSLHLATSRDECLQLISGHITGDASWVQAMGWNHEHWNVPELPTRIALDACSSTKPIVAMRVDGHAMWVNSAALKAAGIDPSGHSGLLVDDAMQPVWESMPVPTQDEVRKHVLSATSEWVRHGVTEIHDMDVAPAWLDVFRELAESGHLPVRIQSFVRGQHREWAREGLLPAGGELHRLAGVKLFADGALGSRGAFLRTAYADDPSNCGIELLSVSDLTDRMIEIVDAGWPCIAVHAIGDAAVRNVLDAYSAIRALPGGSDMILRIEHAQHVAPEDVKRFAELNVLACVQSSHCLSDATMAEKRLGPDRLSWSYRWRSLLSAGVTLTGGSDAPIEPPSVLEGLRAFVDRVPLGHTVAWCSAERITTTEAIDAYTATAHCASGMEYRRGRIEVGYDADLVVVSHDIAADEQRMPEDVTVQATFTAGRLRYAR